MSNWLRGQESNLLRTAYETVCAPSASPRETSCGGPFAARTQAIDYRAHRLPARVFRRPDSNLLHSVEGHPSRLRELSPLTLRHAA